MRGVSERAAAELTAHKGETCFQASESRAGNLAARSSGGGDDRLAIQRLLPGADVWWNCRRWTRVPVIVNAEVLDRLAWQSGFGQCHDGCSWGARAGAQAMLMARVDDFAQTGTIRIIDCLVAGGAPWPIGQSQLPPALQWYGRNVPGIFYGGHWVVQGDVDSQQAAEAAPAHFSRLVRATEGAGVPATVLIQAALETGHSTPTVQGAATLQLAVRLQGLVWQAGKQAPAPAPVEIDRHNTGSLRRLLADAPWYVRLWRRFECEQHLLRTCARTVQVRLLDRGQVMFCVSDPAWLDEVLLVTPNDYPAGPPAVFLRPCDGDGDVRQLQLQQLGIANWSDTSLLVRILYQLERCSAPDRCDVAGRAESERPVAEEEDKWDRQKRGLKFRVGGSSTAYVG